MPLASGTGMLAPHGAGQGIFSKRRVMGDGAWMSGRAIMAAADEKRLGFQDDQLSFVRCHRISDCDEGSISLLAQ
jgi:hypothetical protein